MKAFLSPLLISIQVGPGTILCVCVCMCVIIFESRTWVSSITQAVPFLLSRVIGLEAAKGYVERKMFILQGPLGVFILGGFLKR